MFRKLTETLSFQTAVTPQDISAGVTSSYYSMAGIGRVVAAATTAALGVGKKLTIQFKQAQDAAGLNAKNLGNAVNVVMAAGGAAFGTAEIQTTDMDANNGFTHLAVQISSDNGVAVDGAAVLAFGDRMFVP